jgi:hypothetical protein
MENDSQLGFVTTDCPVCEAMREALRALTAQQELAAQHTDMESDEWDDGLVHPNQFMGVFAERLKHEKKTGHTTLGWKFLNNARAQCAGYAKEDPSMADFWSAFAQRFLVPAGATC